MLICFIIFVFICIIGCKCESFFIFNVFAIFYSVRIINKEIVIIILYVFAVVFRCDPSKQQIPYFLFRRCHSSTIRVTVR